MASTTGLSLSALLPAPSQSAWDRDEARLKAAEPAESAPTTALAALEKTVPPYGHRRGRAFPEIHVAQYPLDLGRPAGMGGRGGQRQPSNALAVQLGPSQVKYDLIARQGHTADKVVYSKFSDLLPKAMTDEDEVRYAGRMRRRSRIRPRPRGRPREVGVGQVSAALPVKAAAKQAPPSISATPRRNRAMSSTRAPSSGSFGWWKPSVTPCRPRVSRLTPRSPAATFAPAPVMHSPTRKVTVKEQQRLENPALYFQLEKSKGLYYSLGQAFGGRWPRSPRVHINEGFSKLAESLLIADRKPGSGGSPLELENLEKKLASKKKEENESKLRELAQKAREERAGIRSASKKDDDEKERDDLRQERHRDRQRQRNLERAAPERRSKLERNRERDVSELVALGLPAKSAPTGEGLFDARLFNASGGMSSGFGDDEAYNVYSEAWRKESNVGNSIYRPGKNVDQEVYGGEDLDTLRQTNRFVPDKEFSGTERGGAGGAAGASRSGPVQFEKDEDPFGLDQFLDTAKRASSKRTGEDDRRDRDRDRKRRKDH
ncbi:hypothetical protein TCAL_16716 [Tigriopus californicus]|uniref:SKI-interacting protein SKIP SNW domain-containing protein n=1 Tax=Tigriopus californicus TaxID=6832 RepID=A0A553PLU4_TIGCA|nr:hypothetical protein TCAL_16716 [Tigriopus californicus]